MSHDPGSSSKLVIPLAREMADILNGKKPESRAKDPPVLAPSGSLPAVTEPLWRRLNNYAIKVNLGAPIKLPLTNAEVAWRLGKQSGWVTVERQCNKLYVDGAGVVLFLADGQKTGRVIGHDLLKELAGKFVLHPNILDALLENIHLLPDSWKRDENGDTRWICFWADGFHVPAEGRLCVRYLFRGNSVWWLSGRYWLDNGFDAWYPSAVLEDAAP